MAIPNALEAGHYIEQATQRHPDMPIISRAHSDREVAYLQSMGADTIIMGEREIARAMMLYFPRGYHAGDLASDRDHEAQPPLKPQTES
ncbi:Inner membrane protein YbaL [compost metagenome]